MGFLDHSTNNIILDAVLTDTGRFRLSKGDGSFKVAKFALGDMETISGYAARSSQIALRMQICTSNLSGHGILVNAET